MDILKKNILYKGYYEKLVIDNLQIEVIEVKLYEDHFQDIYDFEKSIAIKKPYVNKSFVTIFPFF